MTRCTFRGTMYWRRRRRGRGGDFHSAIPSPSPLPLPPNIWPIWVSSYLTVYSQWSVYVLMLGQAFYSFSVVAFQMKTFIAIIFQD